MPKQPHRICCWPGCPIVIPKGKHCDKHRAAERERVGEARQDSRNQFYSSLAWRRFRLTILNRDPVCKKCDRQPSTQVDHIKPISEGGELLDQDNAQGLCRRCHSSKTASQDGRWGVRKPKV